MILGRQTLIELHGCDPAILRDKVAIRELLLEAIRQAGGSYVTDVFHHFSPHGVSGVVVIAESHVTVHTWPEHQYAAVDVFTCSEDFRHECFTDLLRAGVQAQRVETQSLNRGVIGETQV